MEPCSKRQKNVTRPEGSVSYRCLHAASEAHLQAVESGTCESCPVRTAQVRSASTSPRPCLGCNHAANEALKANPTIKADEPEKDIITYGIPDFPSLFDMAKAWAAAVQEWRASGKPTRSDEDVEKILTKYCHTCDWYDSEKRRCKGCGCKVTNGSVAVLNKARMATAHCPKGYW